ncbi:hypothetical protein DFH09DRAFT_1079421 [Mycena vulgaris]|nr:hypothetical protein DFH09DRAFT_1079421 [Mycena vulgaris]
MSRLWGMFGKRENQGYERACPRDECEDVGRKDEGGYAAKKERRGEMGRMDSRKQTPYGVQLAAAQPWQEAGCADMRQPAECGTASAQATRREKPGKGGTKGAIHRERLGVGKRLDVKVKEGMRENARRRKEDGVNKKAERRRGFIARQTEHGVGRKLSDDLLPASAMRSTRNGVGGAAPARRWREECAFTERWGDVGGMKVSVLSWGSDGKPGESTARSKATLCAGKSEHESDPG